jgi:hypothetical protein
MALPDASPQTHNLCPDPETLGAFIAHSLERAERARVAEHLTGCQECVMVVGESSQFLVEEHDENEAEGEPAPMATGTWLGLAAAAVLTLCVGAATWFTLAHRDPLTRLQSTVARLQKRPVEGRLHHFEYSPFSAFRGNNHDSGDLNEMAVQAEAELLNQRHGTDAVTLHARGVALLVTRKAHDAIPLLDRAAHQAPTNAIYASDLAAGHLASGAYLEAMSAARRAIKIDRTLPEAWFNLGRAAEDIGDKATALDSYSRGLELDPKSPWSDEIRTRILSLRGT